MPCYRFRFNDFPLYYYGNVLPALVVKIILQLSLIHISSPT